MGKAPLWGAARLPDYTEKPALFELVEATPKVQLTESWAKWPAAAVSGLYFSHPEST